MDQHSSRWRGLRKMPGALNAGMIMIMMVVNDDDENEYDGDEKE